MLKKDLNDLEQDLGKFFKKLVVDKMLTKSLQNLNINSLRKLHQLYLNQF